MSLVRAFCLTTDGSHDARIARCSPAQDIALSFSGKSLVPRASRICRSMCRRFIAVSAIFLALSCHSGALSADSIVHRYSIRLARVPIGSAVLDASLAPERYAAKVGADIGWLAIRYHVEGETAGRRSGLTLTPETFRMVIPGRTSTTITMRFAGQSVTDYTITPPIASDDLKRRVPITADHLEHVMDPLSALISASLVMGPDPGQLCRESTSLFLGFARFDLQFEPKAHRTAKGSPPAVMCRVIYRPVAGHGLNDPMPARLAASPDIEVIF